MDESKLIFDLNGFKQNYLNQENENKLENYEDEIIVHGNCRFCGVKLDKTNVSFRKNSKYTKYGKCCKTIYLNFKLEAMC
jgi:hypothetical protein